MTQVYRHITGEAVDFLKSEKGAELIGYKDSRFINGYQRVKTVKLTAMYNGEIDSIWWFIIGKEAISGKIGYIVESWTNQLSLQVSKNTGNRAYKMIMAKAKSMPNAEVKIEVWE